MEAINLETSGRPHITFDECVGDLIIVGGGARQLTIEIDGKESDLVVDQKGEAFTLTARKSCYVTVPVDSSVTVRRVQGDVRVRSVSGPLALESAQGDVSLRGVGPAAVRSVQGDLEARRVSGNLDLNRVSGDVRLRHIEGKLTLEQCQGNLNVRDLGGVNVQDVQGDVWLDSKLTSGCEYRLRARGDIRVRVPADSSARCTFEAKGRVHCDLELTGGEGNNRHLTGVVGAGEALLELVAGGDISVQGCQGEWDMNVESRIEAVVDAEMNGLEQRLEKELAGLGQMGTEWGEKMRRKIEKAAEQARRQADKAAERARRQADKAAERARRKEGRQVGGSLGFTLGGVFSRAPQAGSSRPSETEPVSEDERLAILRMVEENKISVNEAALLLEALEG